MEAVARQFVPDGQKAMVLRNGWFSYRWTEILDMAFPGNTHTVLKAVPTPIAGSSEDGLTHFRPTPVKNVVAKIREERPKAFFCPHVETSTGMMLPDEYVSVLVSFNDVQHHRFVVSLLVSLLPRRSVRSLRPFTTWVESWCWIVLPVGQYGAT